MLLDKEKNNNRQNFAYEQKRRKIMIKEFFDEVKRALEEKIRGCSSLGGLKAKKEVWVKDINKGRNYLKPGFFGDVNLYYRNEVSIKEFYPLVILEKEGRDFGLCLEYQSQNGKTSVEYGVRYLRDDGYLDAGLGNQTNCEKLKYLFEDFLGRYENVVWSSDIQKIFNERATFLKKTKCTKKPSRFFYFSNKDSKECNVLISSMTYEESSKVKECAHKFADQMFSDALLIKWF